MRIQKLVQTSVLTGADSGLRSKSENYRARITIKLYQISIRIKK